MGLVRQCSIQDYWGKYWITQSPNLNNTMPRNHFHMVNSFLHFANNENSMECDADRYDPLFKIRPVFRNSEERFSALYIPDQHLGVDEMMVRWKGKMGFKQYMPQEPVKWGIKCM